MGRASCRGGAVDLSREELVQRLRITHAELERLYGTSGIPEGVTKVTVI